MCIPVPLKYMVFKLALYIKLIFSIVINVSHIRLHTKNRRFSEG